MKTLLARVNATTLPLLLSVLIVLVYSVIAINCIARQRP